MNDFIWIAAAALLFLFAAFLTRRPAASPATSAGPVPQPPQPQPQQQPSPSPPPASVAPVEPPPALAALPKVGYEEEDADVEPTKIADSIAAPIVVEVPTKRIVYDEEAVEDEPTHAGELILITATAQTDRGMRRKRNEDSLLVSDEYSLYVVADGMGGYAGGQVASTLAVNAIGDAFKHQSFNGPQHEYLPKRASELARAIQMANDAIRARVAVETTLEGMGTTICAARFSPKKQRLYVGHVGDSRMYRLRDGELSQVTSDHTMERELGITGEASDRLSRAVGVWPTVPVDVIVAKPLAGDRYLLCSDGLTKMVKDETIVEVLGVDSEPSVTVEALVERANASGGKDNITVIVIDVADPLRRRPGQTPAAPAASPGV